MPHLIEVAFTGNRKEFFLWDAAEAPTRRAAVIVEADRGEDLGLVHATGELAEKRSAGCSHGCGTSAPTRRALRLATPAEARQSENLRKLNEEARRHAMERVRALSLMMKISDAEWQWDRRKLTFFFTAEHRVDFRQLVRELASQFRTRIELKQIGVRDEAKRLDGIGRCGRQYCSASWLPELRPVNLGVAKDQRLSLNPAQISGACGRLMCCLRYEHDVYVAARRRFPKEGRSVATTRGEERVVAIDIFNERVTLRAAEGETRTLTLGAFRQETGADGDPATAIMDEDAAPASADIETPDDTADIAAEAASPAEPAPAAPQPGEVPGSAAVPMQPAPAELPTREDQENRAEWAAKRRRGRRGGRGGKRGRGGQGRGRGRNRGGGG